MDHLSSNILMCAMLLLFYASGTVKGAAFGEACNNNDDCTDPNQACDTTCKCSSTAFRNNAGSACVLKVALDADCTDGESADQCADGLAECRDESGFKCLCKADNYKSGSACKVKVALDATCVSGEPATQCVDSLAECRDESGFKCLCKAANYKSGSVCKVKVTIDGACDIADTATDQCSVANTACSDDGAGAKKCLCTSDYYASSSTCVDRKKPGETCASNQCVANAMCNNTTCACNTGYDATPTATPTSCQSSDGAIIIAHMYVFIFGIVASLYFRV